MPRSPASTGAAQREVGSARRSVVGPGDGTCQRRPVEPHALFRRQPSHRRRRGAQAPTEQGLLALAVGGQREAVPGQLGQVVVQLVGPVRLQRVGRRAVQRQQQKVDGSQIDAHGVPGERVGEPQLTGPRLRVSSPDATAASAGPMPSATPTPRTPATTERGRTARPSTAPACHEPAHVRGPGGRPGPAPTARTVRGAVPRRPGPVDDGARDLAHEERVAAGGVVHLDGGDTGGPERIQLPADVGGAQCTQRLGTSSDVRGRVAGPPMTVLAAPGGPSDAGVAQGGDRPLRRSRRVVGEPAQHHQRGLVGPVQVVDDDQQRPGGEPTRPAPRRPPRRRRGSGPAVTPAAPPAGAAYDPPSARSTLLPRPERRCAVGVDAVAPHRRDVRSGPGELLRRGGSCRCPPRRGGPARAARAPRRPTASHARRAASSRSRPEQRRRHHGPQHDAGERDCAARHGARGRAALNCFRPNPGCQQVLLSSRMDSLRPWTAGTRLSEIGCGAWKR